MRRIHLTLGAAALLMALAACKSAPPKEADPVVPVQVEDVKRDSIQQLVMAEGVIHPKDQANLMPKISAPVRKFYVNRGDHVKAGQILATLENRDLAASVEDARGGYEQAASAARATSGATVPDELAKAQSDVQATRQAMESSQKVFESRDKLYKDGALARRLVDEANVTYTQARSAFEIAQKHLESQQRIVRVETVKGAEAQAASAKGKYEGAQAQLSYSEIRSPINGVVTDRPLYAGEMASAGTPILTVMDVSRVIARANIPVSQAALLKVGATAGLSQTDADIQTSGKVTVVSPAVDPNSTTVEIWVEAANPGERLRPGATVHVSILAGTVQDAVVIPPDAILSSASGGLAVLVVGADLVAHERKVELGARESDKAQVLKGLKPGEKVVTVGGLGVADGTKVRIRKPGEKDDEDDKKAKDGK